MTTKSSFYTKLAHTVEQRQRAAFQAESRGVDDETAFELVHLQDEVARCREGEQWIADQLKLMLVAVVPALADAAIVTDGPFHADYVLAWVEQLARTHILVAAQLEDANQERRAEVDHWVERYNELDAWRAQQSVTIANLQAERGQCPARDPAAIKLAESVSTPAGIEAKARQLVNEWDDRGQLDATTYVTDDDKETLGDRIARFGMECGSGVDAGLEIAATIALEQRCERNTPWDMACIAIAQAIRARISKQGGSSERPPV